MPSPTTSRFEFRVGIRNKALMLMNYLFPLGCYVMFGALMGSINPGFLQTIVPAMSVFAVLSGALLGMPDTLVSAREAGIFRSYKINGVPALSILVIPVLTSMLHALLVTVIIALTAPALFDGAAPANWAGFFLVFLVAAFACAGIGALIGVISIEHAHDGAVLAAGVPAVDDPGRADAAVQHAPAGAGQGGAGAADDLRHGRLRRAGDGADGGYASPGSRVGILLAGGAMAFGLAVFLFSWDSKNATRRAHPALAALAWLPYVVGMLLSLRG